MQVKFLSQEDIAIIVTAHAATRVDIFIFQCLCSSDKANCMPVWVAKRQTTPVYEMNTWRLSFGYGKKSNSQIINYFTYIYIIIAFIEKR